LILHAWGMAFLVGGGVAVSLRVLGVASGARMERFAGFFPFMWLGAGLAIVSGIGLLAGYPAKALTNWVFGLTFLCLISAAVLGVGLRGGACGQLLLCPNHVLFSTARWVPGLPGRRVRSSFR